MIAAPKPLGNTRAMRPESLTDDDYEAWRIWLRGNEDALAMWDTLFSIVNVWDDLYDGDRDVEPSELDEAFIQALVDLPRNRFYREHEAELRPLLEQGIQDWQVSNRLVFLGSHFEAAFVLRCSVVAVAIRAATIIGGWSWGVHVGTVARSRLFDDFEEFKAEHGGSPAHGMDQQT